MNNINSDLISRQQAIEAVEKSMYENPHENAIIRGMHDHEHRHFLTILMGLPSAQPEHKTGRWIPTASGKGRHECSRCHEYAPCYQDGSEHLSTFCVLCGAKMERGEEE